MAEKMRQEGSLCDVNGRDSTVTPLCRDTQRENDCNDDVISQSLTETTFISTQ